MSVACGPRVRSFFVLREASLSPQEGLLVCKLLLWSEGPHWEIVSIQTLSKKQFSLTNAATITKNKYHVSNVPFQGLQFRHRRGESDLYHALPLPLRGVTQ